MRLGDSSELLTVRVLLTPWQPRRAAKGARGPILIPIVLAITAITAASFFLNALFEFAIVRSGVPKIRPAFAQARSHLPVILGSGTVVGVMLSSASRRWSSRAGDVRGSESR